MLLHCKKFPHVHFWNKHFDFDFDFDAHFRTTIDFELRISWSYCMAQAWDEWTKELLTTMTKKKEQNKRALVYEVPLTL